MTSGSVVCVVSSTAGGRPAAASVGAPYFVMSFGVFVMSLTMTAINHLLSLESMESALASPAVYVVN